MKIRLRYDGEGLLHILYMHTASCFDLETIFPNQTYRMLVVMYFIYAIRFMAVHTSFFGRCENCDRYRKFKRAVFCIFSLESLFYLWSAYYRERALMSSCNYLYYTLKKASASVTFQAYSQNFGNFSLDILKYFRTKKKCC